MNLMMEQFHLHFRFEQLVLRSSFMSLIIEGNHHVIHSIYLLYLNPNFAAFR